jgi:hypothetical protein
VPQSVVQPLLTTRTYWSSMGAAVVFMKRRLWL